MSMTRADAERLDQTDPLGAFRAAFRLPEGLIYLGGNSLGPPPTAVHARMADVLQREWAQDLLKSWNSNGWMDGPVRVGAKMARLIGAKPHETVIADSTSVNLFKLAAAALDLNPGRRTIVTEAGAFPTDRYILEGLEHLAPERARLNAVPPEAVLDALDDDTAVLVLTHVHYRTSRRWDLEAVTAAAHAKGALVLWDLSHSVGALAVDLNRAGADLAVGCGYKYLNGGPGAPAFAFVTERWLDRLTSPVTGWMGHAEPFAFEDSYRPSASVQRLVTGTPGVLGLAGLEVGVDLQLQADPKTVEAKGLALAELFIALVESRCAGLGVTLASPRDPNQRGLHVSLAHEDAYALVQILIARGVFGDFREVARFGFSALYLSYAQVWDAVEILREVLVSRAFEAPELHARAAVT